jgi:transcription termination factor Rho
MDFKSASLAEMRQFVKDNGIKGCSAMKKAQLAEFLTEYEKSHVTAVSVTAPAKKTEDNKERRVGRPRKNVDKNISEDTAAKNGDSKDTQVAANVDSQAATVNNDLQATHPGMSGNSNTDTQSSTINSAGENHSTGENRASSENHVSGENYVSGENRPAREYRGQSENRYQNTRYQNTRYQNNNRNQNDNGRYGRASSQSSGRNNGYRNDNGRNNGYRSDNSSNNGYRNDNGSNNGYRNDNGSNNGYRNDNGSNNGYRNDNGSNNGYRNDNGSNNGYRNDNGQNNGYRNDNGQNGYRNDNGQNNGYRNDNSSNGYRNDYSQNNGYRNDYAQNNGYRNDSSQNGGYRNDYAGGDGYRDNTSGESYRNDNQVGEGYRQENRQEGYTGSEQRFDSELDSGKVANGILEVMPEGYGFIRSANYLPGDQDIYISPAQIRRFGLKTGDIVVGNIRNKTQGEKFSALLFISSINGMDPSEISKRTNFEDLTPIFPNERIKLDGEGSPVPIRMIDLLSPIGKGQRGMIVSPPKTGKTTLLKQIAKKISTTNKDMHLLVLLIDERPEEVTDIKESIEGPNVEVIYSTFDELPEHHKRVSEMVIERAKRLVEMKRDVVILLDSITRLARAYNLTVTPSGRTLSGGLDPAALHMPKRFFGAARNMREGGSLTILATALVDTGSKMDDVVFEEFKGTGNMELVLDRKLSEKRIFPAIDIAKSGTRRDDLLLSKEELEAVNAIHKELLGNKAEDILEDVRRLFLKTRDNNEFVEIVQKSLIRR